MFQRHEIPRYMKIAVDMAERICEGEFPDKAKLRGRSTLASEYNVSPETIRRAMRLLEDMEVVTVSQGSGIYINSKEKAHTYMLRFKSKESIGVLKEKMNDLLEQKHSVEKQIEEMLTTILDYSDKFKQSSSITPIELTLPDYSHIIGKTIYDTKFWQNTGATIVGIYREDQLIISPGPYAEFLLKDRIIFVGDFYVKERVQAFLFEQINM